MGSVTQEQLYKMLNYQETPPDPVAGILSAIILSIIFIQVFLAAFNLYFYLVYKDRAYLMYVLFQLLFAMIWVSHFGYPDSLFPSNNLRTFSHETLLILLNFFYSGFIRSYLKARQYFRKTDLFLKFIQYCYLPAFFIAGFFLPFDIMAEFCKGIGLVFLILVIYSSIRVYQKGYKPAIFLFWAQVVFATFMCIAFLAGWNLLPVTYLTVLCMPFSSAAEGLIFSYGLRYRSKIEEQETLGKQLEEVKHSALSSQLSTHFIFNCLSHMQELILKNERLQSLNYLQEFAMLTRKLVETSDESRITLSKEIELFMAYARIEARNRKKNFTFEVQVDKNVNPDKLHVPPFTLQPFVEKAIHETLDPVRAKGKVSVTISLHHSRLQLSLENEGYRLRKIIYEEAKVLQDH